MADNIAPTSTPDYMMGFGEKMEQNLGRRVAGREAAYLLPHLKPGMRLLDVGCGPGSISVGLARAVDPGEFHGVDMEESQVELAAAAASEAGLSNARFQVADALDIPFPDNHFDVVHCHAVLTHISDTMAALVQIRRVLRSGGILGAREVINSSCFIEPDIGNLERTFTMLAALLRAKGGHPQMGKELPAKLNEAGFVDILSTGSFEPFGSAPEISRFVDTIMLNSLLGPTIADPAIAQGIATREDFDEWRKAVVVWKDHPGAFAAQTWGECIGHKP